ncbi:MAG: YraN family protein [Muribaculaceae bacterium]|nr:YraN family protein [Muribaculaceae bacterium]
MAQHNILGEQGEQAACEFLIARGMTIRERNWRLNHLEVDIVAQKGNLIHIVEVKTRTANAHFDPMKSVNAAKQRNLIMAANGYLHYNQLRCGVQYDVIIVTARNNTLDVQYIPDAFKPRLRTYR